MEKRQVSRPPSGFMRRMFSIAKKTNTNKEPHNSAVLHTSVAEQGSSNKHEQQQQTEKRNLSFRTKKKEDSLSVDSCFSHFDRASRRYTRCEACFRRPDIVKQYVANNRIPLIAQKCGALFNKASMITHRKEVYHLEALQAYLQDTAEKHVLNKDNEVVGKVGRVMKQVYYEAKELTIDLRSTPGEITLNHTSELNLTRTQFSLKSLETFALQKGDALDHQKYLQCIVDSDEKQSISDNISEALAVSLHCSGSVDKMGIDKFYVRAKVVTKSAEVKVYFLGVGEPLERNAISLLKALESACSKTVGSDILTTVIRKTSSIVMDGIYLDPKETETMRALMKQMQEALSDSFQDLPHLLISWCNVHRSDLAWEAVSLSVEAINNVFQNLTNICRFFHNSRIRLREIKEIAERANLVFKSIPEIFEIKWSDFTSDFLSVILFLWMPLTLYAKKSTDKEAAAILGFLTEIGNINILTFLADVLSVFSDFQENLTSDGVTLVDILQKTEDLRKILFSLIKTPLLGGWVATMEKEIVDHEDNGLMLQGIPLYKSSASTVSAYNTITIRTKIVSSLVDFLMQNLSNNEDIDPIQRFVAQSQYTNLQAVHRSLCPDLELGQLMQEYIDLMEMNNANCIRKKTLHDLIQTLASSNAYPILMAAYSRVLIAKPDLVNVRKMVSLISKWKPSEKLNLSIEVESLCLYIHHNLPAMRDWNPEQAVILWCKRSGSSQQLLLTEQI
ncbi:uncharacterized protein [Palaemon carinicauda]|uniref:uncharacterized protein n=1 Tax=Palaemon carinicauda TaxID=392227 RepID=UPI0035B65E25